jgi:conjugative transfer signal peptidase TraF
VTRRRAAIIAAVLGASTLLAVPAVTGWHPRAQVLWNASASAPLGLYRLHVPGRLGRGDLVVFTPDPQWSDYMSARGYIAADVPLLKRIAALGGARVCRTGPVILIGGRPAALARQSDAAGRPLPRWQGCRVLRGGEVFLLNPAPDSFDSRYFGPVDAARIIARACPVLTRPSAQDPLRWNRTAPPPSRNPAGDQPCA